MQGRSTILTFTLVFLGFEIIRLRKLWPIVLLGSAVAATMMAMIAAPLLSDLQAGGISDQAIRMINLTASDESVAMRAQFFSEAIYDFGAQALVGDAGLIISRTGNYGAYMHNLLSAWQMHGALMFGLSAMAALWALRTMRRAMKNSPGPDTQFFGYLLVYGVVSVTAAKYYTFFPLWMGIGAWLSVAGLRRASGRFRTEANDGSLRIAPSGQV